jgi:hypothetical protein
LEFGIATEEYQPNQVGAEKPANSNIHESTNDSDQVESTTGNNNKIYHMDEKSYSHPKFFFIQACQLESF